jgi:hypothetical protein
MISPRNPNSLSDTIEAAERMVVNGTDMVRAPEIGERLEALPGGIARSASHVRPVPDCRDLAVPLGRAG